MKILHVEAGKHYYGGARQVAYLVEGLAARGVKNVLACPPAAEIAAALGISAHAEIIRTPMHGDADVVMALRLAKLIRATRPNIIHLHSRRGADLWGGIAARLTRTPCVLSRRVDNAEPPIQVALKYRLYDHVITISEAIRNVLLKEGIAPEKVSCVRSAVDANPFMSAPDRTVFLKEFSLPDNALTIGMVAQLIPRKGHRHLLEAVRILRNQYPSLRALLFGKGPLKNQLEQLISEYGLSDIVHLAGFRDDLPRMLGGLDILAHPADMEGLGVSLLQASAAAVPIIASRAGGMPEAVQDRTTGLLIPPGDVQSLVTALRTLLDNPVLRKDMGAAGRARILADFSVDKMVEGNLAVYHSVLKEFELESSL